MCPLAVPAAVPLQGASGCSLGAAILLQLGPLAWALIWPAGLNATPVQSAAGKSTPPAPAGSTGASSQAMRVLLGFNWLMGARL